MSMIHQRGPADFEANLTPMIDVTFLLIVFFVLVSQIVEVENVDLRLPSLLDPSTMVPADEQRVVLNVVPGFHGAASEYRLGTESHDASAAGRATLINALTRVFANNPKVRVNLRADRVTHYEAIQPVLEAVATAGQRALPAGVSPRVNLVVIRDEP